MSALCAWCGAPGAVVDAEITGDDAACAGCTEALWAEVGAQALDLEAALAAAAEDA